MERIPSGRTLMAAVATRRRISPGECCLPIEGLHARLVGVQYSTRGIDPHVRL